MRILPSGHGSMIADLAGKDAELRLSFAVLNRANRPVRMQIITDGTVSNKKGGDTPCHSMHKQ